MTRQILFLPSLMLMTHGNSIVVWCTYRWFWCTPRSWYTSCGQVYSTFFICYDVQNADDHATIRCFTWYLVIVSLQKTSDVFAGDAFGGIDTHFSFCAINSLKLFGQLESIQIRPWNTSRNVRTLTVGLVVVWVQRSILLKVHNSHRTQCGQQTKCRKQLELL